MSSSCCNLIKQCGQEKDWRFGPFQALQSCEPVERLLSSRVPRARGSSPAKCTVPGWGGCSCPVTAAPPSPGCPACCPRPPTPPQPLGPPSAPPSRLVRNFRQRVAAPWSVQPTRLRGRGGGPASVGRPRWRARTRAVAALCWAWCSSCAGGPGKPSTCSSGQACRAGGSGGP